MSSASYKIALVQMKMSADRDENLDRARDAIRRAAKQGAKVVCLPELFRTRYFCQEEEASCFDLAEPVPGPTTAALFAAAREAEAVVLAPVFEKRGPGVYHNSVAVIDRDGSTAGIYRKMHIPDDPGFYEKFYFAPGDLGFRAFDTSVGRIGVLICWDQWYPEAARLVTLQGAEVIFYPTAIGWLPGEKEETGEALPDAWRTVQRGHAVANGVYVAATNRVGVEQSDGSDSSIDFWGRSFVADPQGVVTAEAGGDAEDIVLAEVDRGRLEETRRTWPFLRDRRIDAFEGLTARFLDSPAGDETE